MEKDKKIILQKLPGLMLNLSEEIKKFLKKTALEERR